MDVYIRKTGMSFKQIYKLTKRFKYKEKKNSQRDRPRKYKDEFIIAILSISNTKTIFL